MRFGSIAAVHTVALAAGRGYGAVDLDILPTFAITSVGFLTATPMLVLSKTLLKARKSVRVVVVSWIGLIFGGVVANIFTVTAIPDPMPCDSKSKPGACNLICNVTLPMRDGQSVLSIQFPWQDALAQQSGWSFAGSIAFTVSGLIVKKLLSFQHHNALLLFSLALASIMIFLFERIMMGKLHVPLGENMSAIGQWGPLVGAFFILAAAVMKEVVVDRRTPLPDKDGVADVELAVSTLARRNSV